ncbi:DUF6049 family protein [Candidatus Solincola tengchongensis]|uniref:DUF6049 family protein n=1 Tax=Candidatus Solincola tengchongensis TaxID=2900693 RepID=UPI00257F8F3F|nr:DUF6049 family protein [Candidatus Solincola tengchongensis]
MRRKRKALILAALPVLLCIMSLHSLFPLTSPTKATAQEVGATVLANTDSFYYLPGETALLQVELQIPADMLPGEFALQLQLYSPAITRSYLGSFRRGAELYPLVTRKLTTLTPAESRSAMSFALEPSALGLTPGIHPYEVRLLREGEVVGKDRNFLVIMKPETGYPLNLSLLWTLDFLPSTDARGNLLDGGLAAACSSTEPGFLYSLLEILNERPGMASSLVLPVFIYQELEEFSRSSTPGDTGVGKGAQEILARLSRMVTEGRLDLLNTSYSFCDLGLFEIPGWEQEVDDQVRLGIEGTGVPHARGSGFVNPSFRITDSTMQRMVEEGMDFTVISQEVLKHSAAGKKLLQGTTISQPVRLINSRGSLIKGFVLDESMYAYLEESTAGDPRHLVQNLIAELAVLQRERPYAIRSCVLAFPPGFLPGREFLEALYDALQSCPWVQVRRLEDLSRDQFPLEGVAVQVPESSGETSDYPERLAPLRDRALSFSAAVIPADHPLPDELVKLVLLGMNHRFSDESDQNATRNFLNSLEDYLAGWTSRVNIGRKRSVTLSGTTGNLSVDIVSELNFPIRATLRMENPNLSFPEGNVLEIQVEPRENRYVLPISTHRRGSFLVDIELETNGLVLDSTTITVNTSIINTLAVILLACLLGMVGLGMLARRMWRNIRGGKHARREDRG